MALILHKAQVKELVEGKRVLVSIDVDDTLDTALALLREKKFAAVPVRALQPDRRAAASFKDRPQSGRKRVYPSKMRFIGMLSTVDVALFMAQQQAEASKKGESASTSSFHVRDVMGKTEETRHMLVLDPHATVIQAMEMLGSRGFHRALVPNICTGEHGEGDMPMPALLQSQIGGATNGEEYRVLSQSDVISFLLKHEGQLGLSLAKSLDHIGLVWPSVVAVTPQTSVVEAFDLFRTRGVSALAVVAPSPPKDEAIPSPKPKVPTSHLHEVLSGAGHILLDTLSASDVRAVGEGVLHALTPSTTVGQFLSLAHAAAAALACKEREEEGDQSSSDIHTRLITCTKDTDLRHVMTMLLNSKVHRAWVVDHHKGNEEGPMLVGVVSMTDILRMMRCLPVIDPSYVVPEEMMHDAEEEFQNWDMDSFLWLDWWPAALGLGPDYNDAWENRAR